MCVGEDRVVLMVVSCVGGLWVCHWVRGWVCWGRGVGVWMSEFWISGILYANTHYKHEY